MGIKRNSFFNLVGSTTPILIALICIPIYLRIIGEERYGILALVWVITGYFGLFELGMGRATAYYVAKLYSNEGKTCESFVWSALILNSILGLIGSFLFYFIILITLSFSPSDILRR